MPERFRPQQVIRQLRHSLNKWVDKFREGKPVIPHQFKVSEIHSPYFAGVREPNLIPVTAEPVVPELVQKQENIWRPTAAQFLQLIIGELYGQHLSPEVIQEKIGSFKLFDGLRETPEFTAALKEIDPAKPDIVTHLVNMVAKKPPREVLRELKKSRYRMENTRPKSVVSFRRRTNGGNPRREIPGQGEEDTEEKVEIKPRPVAFRTGTKDVPVDPEHLEDELATKVKKENIQLDPRLLKKLIALVSQLRVLPEHEFITIGKFRAKGGLYKGYYVLHIGHHGRFPFTAENGILYIVIAPHDTAYGVHQNFT